MTSPELDNLVRIGKLQREPPTDDEIAGLLRSAEERLADAARVDLSYSSRFDLAYNAAQRSRSSLCDAPATARRAAISYSRR